MTKKCIKKTGNYSKFFGLASQVCLAKKNGILRENLIFEKLKHNG
jgi:hypothetical protein